MSPTVWSKCLLPRRARVLMRRHGPEAMIWRRRIAILGGAITVGLIALLFARLADEAGEVFLKLTHNIWWAPLLLTPAGFAAFAWVTARFAPEAKGSGIPQVIAASRAPDAGMKRLVSYPYGLEPLNSSRHWQRQYRVYPAVFSHHRFQSAQA